MKLKNVLAILTIVTASCFSATVSAQEHLNALMKKCETMDDVSLDVVQQRSSTTKKISQIIKTVMIKNNKALVDDFLKAFQADKENAIQAIESKKAGGKMVPSFYQFGGKGDSVSYSFDLSKDGNGATVTLIQKGE